ncbi:Gag-Pol polyprotein [Gossypium australe]|uniref:Gag-Pol polyprotein n=1 Tax=Gossypium australe TaxID=47621 RepID=A0A5B6X0J4_9ROSI|nr:Gag-Pol polyprotein [Gossypium australe]
MDPNRAVADDVESNVPPLAQGATSSESRNPPVDKICKYEAEEFRATIDDNPERAELWLENTIQVFDELLRTLAECLKCAISLLKGTAYQWWNTLVFVIEFRKKYISQRFLDQNHKEFLKLKQGCMTVTEYKREFVRLSKYAREYVSTKEIMCKRFVDGLNEDIKLLVRILELKEFVVLVDRACKEKRKVDSEARDLRKRLMNKPYQSLSKKSRDSYTHPNASIGYSNRDRGKQYSSPKAQATSVSSAGSNARPSNTVTRWRPPRNVGNVTSSKGMTKDSTARSEARAPAIAYAIRARDDALSPNVIISTFSLYDNNVIALIDPGSTHSYICENLVSSKKLPVEFTKFMIKVSNPLGKYVLVDKVCKNCPLLTRGYCFSADLMLLPFAEFDVILGMDWLTLHDTIVNCRRKTIELKCQDNEIFRIESSELPAMISSMSAQKCVRKSCEAYLAYVLDIKVSDSKIESVPVVCEYLDVFPKELPGLPLIREVDFAIELVLRTLLISIAP